MSFTTITELGETLQNLLIRDAERLGRESGFIQRQRKLSGASFAQGLVFGWQANPRASLEELCQSAAVCGVQISAQGLQERLNSRQATQFMRQMLEQSLTYLVAGKSDMPTRLEQFAGIYLQDSTTLSLPKVLAKEWRANGNQKGASAGMKVQTVFNYHDGRLQLQLVEALRHDCRLQTIALPAGSLRLADVGYFKVKVFEQLNQQSVWWLTRLPARAGIWVGQHGVHVATWLAQHCSGNQLDVEVELTAQRFRCRLIAVRVPEQVAAHRRKQVCEAAGDRPHKLRLETLALCDWTVIVTNLPSSQLSVEDALVLLRLRWQIELLFKLWKSTFALTSWRTQHPQQILTEIFAKLLLAIIQHWLLLLGCWGELDRSMFKAALVLRKHAFHLAAVLPSRSALVPAITAILLSLSRCSIPKRKAHPATFQLLRCAFA
jgi:hypothetical protein